MRLLIFVLAVIVAGRLMWVNLWSNRGYAPEQPIPFSRKLHAGDNHIPCLY